MQRQSFIDPNQSMEGQMSYEENNHMYKDKILNLLVKHINDAQVPTQDQLCDILSTIKFRNTKTSIQLMIKIIHEIVCPLDQIKSKFNQPQKQYSQFQRHEKRLKQYIANVQKNYFLRMKAQTQTQYNIKAGSQKSAVTVLANKRFLQFSSPYHVVQYFRYQLTSLISAKHMEKEPFSQRLQELYLFKAQGHLSSDYNNDRRTAKIFCLVGPGVRAARQFLGQDLGPNSHCKTISYIVKITFRQLELYVNQNIGCFSNYTQHTISQNHNQNSVNPQPKYFASKRQLSKLKTSLINCHNWMNNQQLELFLIFVKKAYRIVYNEQLLVEKMRQIFILFGRIIKKLLQREILIRNLEALKGNEQIKLNQGQRYYGISTELGLIRLSKKQMQSLQQRNQKKLQPKINNE